MNLSTWAGKLLMNSDLGLQVIDAGIFSQLQDLGRYGQSKQGLSQGGVMDQRAAGWANFCLKTAPLAH